MKLYMLFELIYVSTKRLQKNLVDGAHHLFTRTTSIEFHLPV